MKILTLLPILLLLAVFVSAQDTTISTVPPLSSSPVANPLNNIIDGITQIYTGMQELGMGLVAIGTSIVRFFLPDFPYWLMSLIEVLLALFCVYKTLQITGTMMKFAALFFALMLVLAIILGGVHLIGT